MRHHRRGYLRRLSVEATEARARHLRPNPELDEVLAEIDGRLYLPTPCPVAWCVLGEGHSLPHWEGEPAPAEPTEGWWAP